MITLQSYLAGQWQQGTGTGSVLRDPVTGDALAQACGDGLDLAAALEYARATGGPALRAMSYAARAGLINQIAGVLTANRDRYVEIALKNSGNTAVDAMMDIDGGIGTLKYYASLGRKLGEVSMLAEAGSDQLAKDETFRVMHLWTPLTGVAVHINAFNFPSWGLWEKAAVALLAGVPLLAKPATATCWLSYEMIRDIVAAGIVPAGVLSLLCGGGRDLMDHVRPGDVVSFTGSADTALMLRSHPNVLASNIRFGVEADSLNLCCLGPDVAEDGAEFGFFLREVVKELTIKAGQKCTAIRRILVPRAKLDAVIAGLSRDLAAVKIGDPRDSTTRMGPLVSKAQQAAAWEGFDKLSAETRVVIGGDRAWVPDGIDPAKGCFFPPTLLVSDQPMQGQAVHAVEVFGPLATVMPYDSEEKAVALALLGGGSLAASLFTADDGFATRFAAAIAPAHGRILVVDASIGKAHTGHGNAMPQCVHGGPGRAGGGEELGGLRGLRFYLQRSAIQATQSRLEALRAQAATVSL